LSTSCSSPVVLPPVAALEAELNRRRYGTDPGRWMRERLGEHPWSRQVAIAESVRDHRRTAVRSAHSTGKSWLAARIAAWWLDTNPVGEAFVVTTAPTFPQVRAILWREINRAHAAGRLPGRVNQTEWWMPRPGGGEELVAFGRKPGDMDPSAFQGIHAARVLVVVDEACGVPVPLWNAADSLISSEESRMLAIGNPDDPATEFHEVCKPGSGWHVLVIGAEDTPNFTGEPLPEKVARQLTSRTWVEEKRHKWATVWRWETGADGREHLVPPANQPRDTSASPLWFSKVLGEFPTATQDGLIPIAWIRAAQERDLRHVLEAPTPPPPKAPGEADDAYKARLEAYEAAKKAHAAIPHELGVDVGGGQDRNTIAERYGPVVRILSADQNPDTMQTCGRVIQALRSTGATRAKVDYIGIGRGVVDRGREQGHPFVGVNVGEAASDTEAFANLRAELWWGMRERFEAGDVDLDPQDDDLAAELCALRYKTTSRGQILIESKDDMRRRGLDSPDRADALMLALAKTGREPGDFGITI